jgi:hypothetical protein
MILLPRYRFFNERLVVLNLSDIYDRHPVNITHMDQVRRSIQKQGLLLPMVVDHKKHVISGSHRYKVIREMAQHRQSLFYVAHTPEESRFFDALCKAVYQQHKLGTVDHTLQFMFEGDSLRHSLAVKHLFQAAHTK